MEPKHVRKEGPMHTFFGLSYASYLGVPRMVTQAMPVEWQQRLVDLLEEVKPELGWTDHNDYAVNVRNEKGRFIMDPLRHYRRGIPPWEGGER